MLPKRFLRLPVGPDTAKLTALDQKSKPARFKNGADMPPSARKVIDIALCSTLVWSAAQHIHFAGADPLCERLCPHDALAVRRQSSLGPFASVFVQKPHFVFATLSV